MREIVSTIGFIGNDPRLVQLSHTFHRKLPCVEQIGESPITPHCSGGYNNEEICKEAQVVFLWGVSADLIDALYASTFARQPELVVMQPTSIGMMRTVRKTHVGMKLTSLFYPGMLRDEGWFQRCLEMKEFWVSVTHQSDERFIQLLTTGWLDAGIHISDPETVELAHAGAAALGAIRHRFFGELSEICESLTGGDMKEVRRAIMLDPEYSRCDFDPISTNLPHLGVRAIRCLGKHAQNGLLALVNQFLSSSYAPTADGISAPLHVAPSSSGGEVGVTAPAAIS